MHVAHAHSLANEFEAARGQLRALAFRMLGSLHEADDALQEAWLRASRSELQEIASVPAWLTTIVSRVCLDHLRTRQRRAEEALDMHDHPPHATRDPEGELAWVRDVGSALLVVMDTLGPAERIAFVLHDLFGHPFEEIAEVVERTPVAAKKLASRARARVLGRPRLAPELLRTQRGVIEVFLRATRARDVDGILAVLAPDVVRRTQHKGQPSSEIHGAEAVSREALHNTKSARIAELVLIDGRPGLIVAPRGRLAIVLRFTVAFQRIVTMDVTTDHGEVGKFQIRLFEVPGTSLG